MNISNSLSIQILQQNATYFASKAQKTISVPVSRDADLIFKREKSDKSLLFESFFRFCVSYFSTFNRI
ncbi:hypothetical protein BpHYR1_008067 [Brachionus plicatilis]|uniref:Uncharacterized protein n=1 Tax=Brachionus plicatilis TaxID=10195 RepID=A0A3M7T3J8_BRAPC|nr:hypothetical protein BpHYR1_008067 [Brachionus plicatilis]